jgi:hypothetical protein
MRDSKGRFIKGNSAAKKEWCALPGCENKPARKGAKYCSASHRVQACQFRKNFGKKR